MGLRKAPIYPTGQAANNMTTPEGYYRDPQDVWHRVGATTLRDTLCHAYRPRARRVLHRLPGRRVRLCQECFPPAEVGAKSKLPKPVLSESVALPVPV